MGEGRGGGGGGGESEGGCNKKKKGLWTEKEDKILREYISVYGEGKWNRISKLTGLKRSGKSCRLRWMNYLTPNLKKDDFSHQEEDLIIRLHKLLGNRWSLIAGRIPGRTDNQVKNHWNTHLSKKLGQIQKRKNQKISCIPLSSNPSIDELDCHTKGKEIAFNNYPSNSSSNHVMVEDGSSSWSTTEFGTSNSTIQAEQDDQMMSECFNNSSFWFSNEYSNLNNANTLTPVLDGYPFDVIWDGLWLYDH